MLRLLQRSPKATNSGVDPEDSEPTPLALLEFQSPTAAIIATPMPAMARHTVLWITLLIFILLLIAIFKHTDQVVVTTGEVVSEAPTVDVQAFNAAIVSTINVKSGQLVRRGDVLATLDPTIAAANLQSLTQQEQGYAAQVAQLQAQENGKPYQPDPTNPASALQMATFAQQVGQYNFTMDDYNQKIKELQTNIDGYHAQAAYYRERLGVASNIEDMRKNLQQLQVGSKLDTLSATDDRLNMQSSLASAESSAEASSKELASQTAERNSFDQQWKATISQQLATALNSLAQAQQQLVAAKLNDQLVVLTAPEDAIVQTVAPVSVGAVLASGTTLMELVPINAPLSIEVDLDGEDTGFVHVGDNVNIKFQTFPYVQYGMAKGRVTSISPDSFNPNATTTDPAAGAPLPQAPTDLYYKAEISIEELNLHNLPSNFRLVPGMPVEGDIKVGTKTILQYFAKRIMPTVYDSMHEPP
jgi:HlyD family secretion protein